MSEAFTCTDLSGRFRALSNLHDPFAVKVLKTDEVVSHLPRRISSLCSSLVSESKRTDSLAAIQLTSMYVRVESTMRYARAHTT